LAGTRRGVALSLLLVRLWIFKDSARALKREKVKLNDFLSGEGLKESVLGTKNPYEYSLTKKEY